MQKSKLLKQDDPMRRITRSVAMKLFQKKAFDEYCKARGISFNDFWLKSCEATINKEVSDGNLIITSINTVQKEVRNTLSNLEYIYSFLTLFMKYFFYHNRSIPKELIEAAIQDGDDQAEKFFKAFQIFLAEHPQYLTESIVSHIEG